MDVGPDSVMLLKFCDVNKAAYSITENIFTSISCHFNSLNAYNVIIHLKLDNNGNYITRMCTFSD